MRRDLLPILLLVLLFTWGCSKNPDIAPTTETQQSSTTTTNPNTTGTTGTAGKGSSSGSTSTTSPSTSSSTSSSTSGSSTTTSTPPVCEAIPADLNSISVFPADNPWNQDISNAPLDPNSNQIIASLNSAGVKANFGSGLWNNAPMGIPFTVVCGSQPKVKVTWRANAMDGNYG
ncbi:MAG: hypothetical protein ACTHJ8_10180, partial [Mucilaginibacter sp.]